MVGGPGDDAMNGTDGDDNLFGGPGDHTLSGGPGLDYFDCGGGGTREVPPVRTDQCTYLYKHP